ncbi:MAG: hypothetical protein R6V56_02125 [Lentisphaeria bacterium]
MTVIHNHGMKNKSRKVAKIAKNEGKSDIKGLKEIDVKIPPYVKKLKEGKKKAMEGGYSEAKEILTTAIDEMEHVMEESKLMEELEEADIEESPAEDIEEVVGKLEEVEVVESEVEELEVEGPETGKVEEETMAEVEVTEEEVTVEDIENKVKEIKSLLLIAKDHDIVLEDGKDVVDQALKSTEKQDFESTLESLEQGRVKVETSLRDKIDEKMVNIELLSSESEESDNIDELIDSARAELTNDNFEDALELLADAKELVERGEEPVAKAEDKLADVESLIFDAEIIGVNTSEGNELLNKAKEELDVGDWEKAEEYAEEAKEKVLERVPETLKSEIKEAQTELKKAKISGIDVSEPIKLLKRASYAQEEGDMEKCLRTMKRYREIMKKLWDEEW